METNDRPTITSRPLGFAALVFFMTTSVVMTVLLATDWRHSLGSDSNGSSSTLAPNDFRALHLPRPATPRDELTQHEQRIIDIYRRMSSSVVHVWTSDRQLFDEGATAPLRGTRFPMKVSSDPTPACPPTRTANLMFAVMLATESMLAFSPYLWRTIKERICWSLVTLIAVVYL